MNIQEDYVSFETAKLLKEKGFDWECFGYYVDDEPDDVKYSSLCETNSIWEERCCSAPTLQMAMKWLREREWFIICIIPFAFYCGEKAVKFGYNIWVGDNLEVDEFSTPKFNTYEEAAEAGIKYCLEKI